MPLGDAIADPLTGVRAAAEAARVLLNEHAQLIDLSMLGVVQEAVAAPGDHHEARVTYDDGWWVRIGSERHRVEPPTRRTITHRVTTPVPAAAPGSHNTVWLP